MGNWWDDYTGSDEDGDGIGDKPYTIEPRWVLPDNKDKYPIGKFNACLDDKPPLIEIQKPLKGAWYYANQKIPADIPVPTSLGDAVVIGPIGGIDIVVYAKDDPNSCQVSGVDYVEFWLSDIYQDTDNNQMQFNYFWHCSGLRFGKFNLVARAYDNSGLCSEDSIEFFMINIF